MNKEISNDLISFWVENADKSAENLEEFSLISLQKLHERTFFPKELDSLMRYNSLSDNDKDHIVNNNPGLFRPSEGRMKLRQTRYTPFTHISVYSTMEEQEIAFTKEYLEQHQVKDLIDLSDHEKVKRLAKLYEELDYLHPFYDGNSRTNRVFLGQLAEKIGIELLWNKIDKDDFFIARDLSNLHKVISRGVLTDIPSDIARRVVDDYKEITALNLRDLTTLLLDNYQAIS